MLWIHCQKTVARWCGTRGVVRRLKMAASSSEVVSKDGMVAPKHQQLHQLNGFNRNGRSPATPFVIGVAGGTASGKSTVCQRIMEKLGQDNVDRRQRQVVCISQDSFYKELNEEDKAKAFKGMYNFDHPDAFDNELTVKILHDILNGQVVNIPVYDFKTNARHVDEHITIYPADVVLFEGILVFYFAEMRDLFHMKLFVDTDSDTRLSRRVLRDIKERDRDLEQIIYQYTTFVKPAFEEFCLPTKKYADVIIPRGADNTVAIDLIVQHIKDLLRSNRNCLANRLRHNSDSFVTRPH